MNKLQRNDPMGEKQNQGNASPLTMAQLERLAHEYQTVFDGTQDATFLIEVLDRNTFRFLRNNRYHQEATGLSPEDLQGKTPEEMLGAELGRKVTLNYTRCIDEGRPVSYEELLPLPAGEKIWHTILTPVKDRGTWYIVGSSRDITKEKLALKALQESEENFHRSVAESPFGIRIVNKSGKTIYANKALLGLFQISTIEEFNRKSVELWYTPDSYKKHLARKKRRKTGEDEKEYEISIIRKDGEIRHINVFRKEVIWNREPHYEIINQDITEKKLLNLDLIRAREKAEESDRLKSAFLATISHELRTPLTSIIGFSDLIRSTAENERDREHASIIHDSGKQFLEMIENLFDLALFEEKAVKVKEQPVTLISIHEKLKDTLSKYLVKHGKKDLLDVLSRPDQKLMMKTIYSDRSKILQALSNLLDNAVRFTNKGAIEFGFYSRKEGEITFYVKDTGIGLPEEKQDVIFDTFRQVDDSETRKFGGLGIGLNISKRIAEIMNGSLTLDSKPGEGSVFYLTLPVRFEEKETAETKTATGADRDRSKKTVMIVEDYENTRNLIRLSLRQRGFKTLEADNGEKAVSLFKTNPDTDLILMDLNMPVMDGFTATLKIREHKPDIPIIAVTAYSSESDVKKALDAGCDEVITKPFDLSQLVAVVSRYLDCD